jgi:hypothetical protein
VRSAALPRHRWIIAPSSWRFDLSCRDINSAPVRVYQNPAVFQARLIREVFATGSRTSWRAPQARLSAVTPRKTGEATGRPGRLARRIIAGGALGLALVALGAAPTLAAPANGVQQINAAPASASTTAGAILAASLNIGAAALGNQVAVATPAYGSADSQSDLAPVNAGVVLNNLQVDGDAVIQAQAGANSDQVIAPQGGTLQTVQAVSNASTAARVQIGDQAGATQSFVGAAQVNATAAANLLAYDAASGQIVATATQTNAGPVAAAATVGSTAFNGVLTGATTAAGNEIDLDQGAAASGTIGDLLTMQVNAGAETALTRLSGVQTTTTGNVYATSAVGNALNAGDLVAGVALTQISSAPQTARLTLSPATLNGDFSVQAVGNQTTLGSNGAIGLHQQNDANQLAEVVSSAGLVLNGATTMTAVALGNNFSGTVAPAQIAGQEQQVNSGFQTASINLTGASAMNGTPISLTAIAIGNAATLSAPDSGFVQANYTGGLVAQTATVTLSNCTFTSSAAVSTTAQGNLITIRH